MLSKPWIFHILPIMESSADVFLCIIRKNMLIIIVESLCRYIVELFCNSSSMPSVALFYYILKEWTRMP